jgi:hypothetical protein
MTAMILTAEQRRVLALLANADGNRATQQLLAAHGFSVPTIAGLVNHGLTTLTREHVNAGGKTVEVGKVRITDAPRSRPTEGRGRHPHRSPPFSRHSRPADHPPPISPK